MTNTQPFRISLLKSRYGFAAFFGLTLLIALTLLRGVLFFEFGSELELSTGSVSQAFLIGLQQDITIALLATLPLFFWFWIVREKSFGKRWHQIFLILAAFVFWSVQVFLLFTEYYFFEEFRSRFNTVAVDYLLYPDEVVGNIRESYPLFTIIAICMISVS